MWIFYSSIAYSDWDQESHYLGLQRTHGKNWWAVFFTSRPPNHRRSKILTRVLWTVLVWLSLWAELLILLPTVSLPQAFSGVGWVEYSVHVMAHSMTSCFEHAHISCPLPQSEDHGFWDSGIFRVDGVETTVDSFYVKIFKLLKTVMDTNSDVLDELTKNTIIKGYLFLAWPSLVAYR